jgi:putative PIN family toxin of toxin-antitoxin system
MTPRVVFDCMVFVQALANDAGPASACFDLARQGRVELCVSPDVLAEVREVLNRPKLRKKLPALTPERAEAFLEDVLGYATVGLDVPPRFRYDRDPKDEPYINLALVAGAHYLASRDKDLLDLAEDEDFRRRFPDLTILDPVSLLRAITQVEDTREL